MFSERIIKAVDLDRYVDPEGYTVQVDLVETADEVEHYMLYVWDDKADECLLEREVSSLHEGLGEMAVALAWAKGEYD